MVLFPVAVLWLVVVLVWVLRQSRNEPEEQVWRRWRPSPPRDSHDRGGAGSGRAPRKRSARASDKAR